MPHETNILRKSASSWSLTRIAFRQLFCISGMAGRSEQEVGWKRGFAELIYSTTRTVDSMTISTAYLSLARKSYWLLSFRILSFLKNKASVIVRIRLSIFRCVRRIAKSDYQFRHVCPSLCPSVSPHGTTRLPLDGFSWILKFDYFLENP
jgi:hypothetical protein